MYTKIRTLQPHYQPMQQNNHIKYEALPRILVKVSADAELETTTTN
jgi:hypothetical protein